MCLLRALRVAATARLLIFRTLPPRDGRRDPLTEEPVGKGTKAAVAEIPWSTFAQARDVRLRPDGNQMVGDLREPSA